MPLVGMNAESVARILHRLERPGIRFLLGFLRWIRRPIVRLFVVDAGGLPVATAVLTFVARAGYVSAVVVDAPHRRKGFAHQMLSACERATQSAGRRYAVLDVLEGNAPARALYEKLGYRWLRDQQILTRDLDPSAEPAHPSPRDTVRSFKRGDARKLAEAVNRMLPPEVARVLPAVPSQFHIARFVTDALESETAAWVAPPSGAPQGFLRATVGRLMRAGNLTAPVLADELPEPFARDLLRTAIAWLEARRAPRVISEVPVYATRSLTLLRDEGFQEAFRIRTLVHPLGP